MKSFGMYIVTYITVVVASQNTNLNKKTTRNPTDVSINFPTLLLIEKITVTAIYLNMKKIILLLTNFNSLF